MCFFLFLLRRRISIHRQTKKQTFSSLKAVHVSKEPCSISLGVFSFLTYLPWSPQVITHALVWIYFFWRTVVTRVQGHIVRRVQACVDTVIARGVTTLSVTLFIIIQTICQWIHFWICYVRNSKRNTEIVMRLRSTYRK